MRHSFRNLLVLGGTLVTARLLGGVPAPYFPPLPGALLGSLQSRWVAPYVSVTSESVRVPDSAIARRREPPAGGAADLQTAVLKSGLFPSENWRGQTTIRWYKADGTVRKEMAGEFIIQTGYAEVSGQGRATFYALNGTWELGISTWLWSGPFNVVEGTPDSHFLVCQHGPDEKTFTVDLYRDGKPDGTLGPYFHYRGDDLYLSEDGSLACLVRKHPREQLPTVVVVGPDGKISFETACERAVSSAVAAPNGSGVLLGPNDGKSFNPVFYSAAGKRTLLAVNARFLAWVPGNHQALFGESGDGGGNFQLVDCDSGNPMWTRRDPAAGRRPHLAAQVVIADRLVLISGYETVHVAGSTDLAGSFYALDVGTGALIASWKQSLYGAGPAERNFLKLGGRLFVVGDQHVSEIDLADIGRHQNGWALGDRTKAD